MYFNPDDRHILVISGKQSECLNFAKKLVADLDYAEINEPKKANSLLGQEFDAIIFHSHSSLGNKFNPNAFGAVTGTIRGGGFLLLLKPKNYPADSLFLKRFGQLIKSNENVHFLDQNTLTLYTYLNHREKPLQMFSRLKTRRMQLMQFLKLPRVIVADHL